MNGQSITPDMVFELDESQEIKNLIKQGYLEEVKKDG